MTNASEVPESKSNDPIEFTTSESSPRLLIEAADSFNYAAWQNAVPLLRSVVIDNTDGPELSSLVIELRAKPQFSRPRQWMIDRLAAGEQYRLRDFDLEIDPAYLDGLDEAERGVLTLQIFHKGACVNEKSHLLRVLARDEWGGMSSMGNLLPAFVTPNDPAVAPLLVDAANNLSEHGHSPSMDGYQSGDPNRAFLLTAALWSAIAKRSLIYANPPGSFERDGQKTRRVGTVLSDRLATCLDTSLIFASALESIGLNPFLVLTKGHCFAGVWLVPKTFKRLIESDSSEVRKALSAKELIVFETTLVTHRPPGQFTEAAFVARQAVTEEKEADFVAAIDVARARMSQVRPLASHVVRPDGEATEGETAMLPLPASPGISLPAAEVEERPTTPAGRIERWQRKLLDLSLRNQLLNFRPTKQTVPVLCPDISRLEDRLADGVRLRLVSLPESNPLGKRDAELHQRRTKKDLDLEFVRQAFERDEVACPVDQRELDVRLTALFRKVRNDLAEGGSNTLYLAVGFLRWKQNPRDEKSYRAPLLLIPVTLSRRSASSPFYLTSHEEEVRFNSTLVQLLKKDFDCDLSSLESDLPKDDCGINVPLVLERMRHAVRDISGFEIIEEAAISPFSFAKFLMWKDLVDRVDLLERNRVVRHLIREPDKAFVNEDVGPIPQSQEMDFRYSPAEIVHPLPADSSQLAAVMAASEGHDMVIVGPPGTGKSQTIANVITQCLAVGKTVLFVAEKTAALDVVHRRLKKHGLGDCCIELHSNKAERRRFLDQLEAAWKNRGPEDASEWQTVNEQLRIHRDQLNEYAAAIHAEAANGWTAYRAIGEWVRGRQVGTPPLRWPTTIEHNREQYKELMDTVVKLATVFRALPQGARLPRVEVTDWSIAWENNLLEACRQLSEAADMLLASIKNLASLVGRPEFSDVSTYQLGHFYRLSREISQQSMPSVQVLLHPRIADLKSALQTRKQLLQQRDQARGVLEFALKGLAASLGKSAAASLSDDQMRSLYRLAGELVRPQLPPAALVFHADLELLESSLAERPGLIVARSQAREALLARAFNPALIDRVDLIALDREWGQVNQVIWPFSLLKKTAVKRKLKAYMTPAGCTEPEVDLPLLREYHDFGRQLAENLAGMGLPPELQAVADGDPAQVAAHLPSARQLREVINAAGSPPIDAGKAVNCDLAPLIDAARRIYAAGREYESLRARLKDNLANLSLTPPLQAEVERDVDSLSGQIQSAISIRKLISGLGIAGENLVDVLQRIGTAPEQTRRGVGVAACRCAKAFQEAWSMYLDLAKSAPSPNDSASIAGDAAVQAKAVLERRALLKQWTSWMSVRARAIQLGLDGFVEQLQSGEIAASELVSRFQLAYSRWWLPIVVDRREPLRKFQKFLHEGTIEEFRHLDELARAAATRRARLVLEHGLPPSDKVPRQSELGLLRHQMNLKRPSKSIREVIAGLPGAFGKLAPCLLMSPLSIAQYLPAGHAQFDVVVFDEASQIATWDAIGAIARGKQTIIVGDPKQLPPSNFFGRTESDDDNTELADYEKDLESILDEVQASGLPTLQLNWHYRSKHESLIAFSNWNYYGNRLVTFPASESVDRGVSLQHVKGGLFDRGKSRTNRQEAEAIVADLVGRMKRSLSKPEDSRLTYGVVTFNSPQQELIQDLLDEAQRKFPELEWFFADERIEPTVVKNLENVQGDERDVMLFSITFGFDAAGKFPVSFGAINSEGGERRLNVAITRARQELVVYSSFMPDQLAAERSSKRGVHDLKSFLEYAHKGPEALLARIEGSRGGFDSPLEEAIAVALESRGWRVETQVGVSGFRIDLGIIHPDKPGAYLAGVECDGATYHRSAVARDRDKIREEVLTRLGWRILRVWSTDWWYDADCALEEIHIRLNAILEQDRIQAADEGGKNYTVDNFSVFDVGGNNLEMETESVGGAAAKDIDSSDPNSRSRLVARQSSANIRCFYFRFQLGDATESQNRFFDDDYSEEVRRMALAVLATQGPIRDEELVREVARAHGFVRAGSRIKQRILALLPDVTSLEEAVGRFLWPGPDVPNSVPFRYPRSEEERRNLDEIPMAELVGLVRENPTLQMHDDPALLLAREIGLARLSQTARERLEEALTIGAAQIKADESSNQSCNVQGDLQA